MVVWNEKALGNILLQSSKTADIWPVPPGNWNCILIPVFFFRRINGKLKREIFEVTDPREGVRMNYGALRQIWTSGSWGDAAQLQETGKVIKYEIPKTKSRQITLRWSARLHFPWVANGENLKDEDRPPQWATAVYNTMFNPVDLFLQQSTSLCKSSYLELGVHNWIPGNRRSFS